MNDAQQVPVAEPIIAHWPRNLGAASLHLSRRWAGSEWTHPCCRTKCVHSDQQTSGDECLRL